MTSLFFVSCKEERRYFLSWPYHSPSLPLKESSIIYKIIDFFFHSGVNHEIKLLIYPFSFSRNAFYPINKIFYHFSHTRIVVYKCFVFEQGLKMSSGKGLIQTCFRLFLFFLAHLISVIKAISELELSTKMMNIQP